MASGLLVLFAACGNQSSRPSHAASAQIVGAVTAGPSCPVERAASPCPNRPVPGALVRALHGLSAVASTRADAQGRYRLTVDPGDYTVVATNMGGLSSTAQRHITVVANSTTTADLVVDSGIR
jgi:Carboxypeptidase regulatory-like domain